MPFLVDPLGALCAATVLLLATATAGQPQRCTILHDCAGIDSLPTAVVCEEDDCSCAQQGECYLRGQSPTTQWPLLPRGEVRLNRNFFHDQLSVARCEAQPLSAIG